MNAAILGACTLRDIHIFLRFTLPLTAPTHPPTLTSPSSHPLPTTTLHTMPHHSPPTHPPSILHPLPTPSSTSANHPHLPISFILPFPTVPHPTRVERMRNPPFPATSVIGARRVLGGASHLSQGKDVLASLHSKGGHSNYSHILPSVGLLLQAPPSSRRWTSGHR